MFVQTNHGSNSVNQIESEMISSPLSSSPSSVHVHLDDTPSDRDRRRSFNSQNHHDSDDHEGGQNQVHFRPVIRFRLGFMLVNQLWCLIILSVPVLFIIVSENLNMQYTSQLPFALFSLFLTLCIGCLVATHWDRTLLRSLLFSFQFMYVIFSCLSFIFFQSVQRHYNGQNGVMLFSYKSLHEYPMFMQTYFTLLCFDASPFMSAPTKLVVSVLLLINLGSILVYNSLHKTATVPYTISFIVSIDCVSNYLSAALTMFIFTLKYTAVIVQNIRNKTNYCTIIHISLHYELYCSISNQRNVHRSAPSFYYRIYQDEQDLSYGLRSTPLPQSMSVPVHFKPVIDFPWLSARPILRDSFIIFGIIMFSIAANVDSAFIVVLMCFPVMTTFVVFTLIDRTLLFRLCVRFEFLYLLSSAVIVLVCNILLYASNSEQSATDAVHSMCNAIVGFAGTVCILLQDSMAIWPVKCKLLGNIAMLLSTVFALRFYAFDESRRELDTSIPFLYATTLNKLIISSLFTIMCFQGRYLFHSYRSPSRFVTFRSHVQPSIVLDRNMNNNNAQRISIQVHPL
jgi:hypothetical protein